MTTISQMTFQPFTEKYRPQTFEEIHSHDQIKKQLQKFIDQNQLPHLLFFGPPGTGKTTTVHALARMIFGAQYRSKIIELNASDENGIDVVREKIIGFVKAKNLFQTKDTPNTPFSNLKLIILDECDQMSNIAQGALRRVMETSSQNARFILLCNYPQKIIPPLLSRTAKFRFRPVPKDFTVLYLQKICDSENFDAKEEFLGGIYEVCTGDLRQSLNLLQQCISLKINSLSSLYQLGSKVEKSVILRLLEVSSYCEKFALISEIVAGGIALDDLIRQITNFDMSANMIIQLAEIEEGVGLGADITGMIAGVAGILIQ